LSPNFIYYEKKRIRAIKKKKLEIKEKMEVEVKKETYVKMTYLMRGFNNT
jgi:hypothetical protein